MFCCLFGFFPLEGMVDWEITFFFFLTLGELSEFGVSSVVIEGTSVTLKYYGHRMFGFLSIPKQLH